MLPDNTLIYYRDILTYARYGNPEPPRRVVLTAAEWQQRLTAAEYRVLREAHTEPPYRNAYCRSYEPGAYVCAGCGSRLFEAEAKYHGMSGWPSFTQPATRAAISYYPDDSHHMQRVEVRCNCCGGHLGHVFADGPAPAGLRYCLNSASLRQVAVGEQAVGAIPLAP